MATRRERVVLELDDQFSAPTIRAAASARLLQQSLDNTRRTSDGVPPSLSRTERAIADTGATSRRSGADINQFSGRLSLLVRAGTAVGPAFASISALAVPALTSLANVVGVVGVAVGTTLLAFHGLGDALKALDKAQLEPTAENLAKAQKAMDALSPSARGLVMQLDAMEPIFDSLREAAGQDMFPGLRAGLTDALAVAPQVRSILKEVGGAVGELGQMTGESLASGKWNEFLTFLRAEVPPATVSLGKSVGNLASAAAQLWMAFEPLNSGVLNGFEDITSNIEGWATTLDDTVGFQKFLDYLQGVGPQAGAALGAIANALLQIGEAAAPLGGPTLRIIETLADAIAGIANSPIGTPLAALATGAATLSLLNKGLMQTRTLMAGLSATGVGGAAAAGAGGGGIGAYFQENAEQMRDAARTMRTEGGNIRSNLGIVASSFGVAGAASERQTTRLRAATTGLRNFRAASVQMAGAAAGTVAPLAAMALSATDIDEKMGLSNTAMLGLMGTMAGPWGAAIGAGVGGLLDLKASGDDANSAILTLNETLGKGDTTALTNQIAAAKKQMDDLGDVSGVGDLFGDLKGRASMNLNGGADAFKAQISAAEKANEKLKEYQFNASSAGQATNNLSQFMDQSYRAALRETGGIEGAIEAMKNMRKAALETADAELNYKSAILDANDAIKENGKNTNLNTRGGIANRQALDSLAGAWNGQSDAAKNAKGAMADARANFIRTAEAMGYSADRARALAKRLMEIPSKRVTVLQVEDYATAKIAAIKSELNSIDRNIEVYVNIRRPNAGGMGPQVGGSADGSTIPGPRYPYADKMLYLLAPGEEVISNRHGQADRHRALLKDINAGRLADGGTAQGKAKRTRHAALVLPEEFDSEGGLKATARSLKREFNQLERQIKRSTAAVDRSSDAVDNERQHRDDLVSQFESLASTIKGQFQTELFGAAGNPFASAGPTNDPLAVLRADIANSQQFGNLFAGLQDRGLSGGALQAGAAGGIAGLQTLSAYNGDQLAEFQRLFDQREQMGAAVGQQVAQAQFGASLDQSNIYLETLVQQNAELIARNADLLAAQRDTKQATQAVELATKGVGSSAAKGQRSKTRSRR